MKQYIAAEIELCGDIYTVDIVDISTHCGGISTHCGGIGEGKTIGAAFAEAIRNLKVTMTTGIEPDD
jgi:hypothetical protein